MCGRFTITADRVELILDRFKAELSPAFEGYKPRFNAAPAQFVPTIIAGTKDQRYLVNTFWGLVTPWGDKIGKNSQINVRDDTILKNRFFRNCLLNNRCVFVADGFFEWGISESQKYIKNGKKIISIHKKIPYRVAMNSDNIFPIAGLWRTININDKEIKTSAIITTRPNPLIERIHNRMPVILSDENLKLWLNLEFQDFKLLHAMLEPYPLEDMKAYPVSLLANNTKNDSQACITPADISVSPISH